MSGSFGTHGELDVSSGLIIDLFGKKKSGKSVCGMLLARSYPGDLFVLDVAGDDGPMPVQQRDIVAQQMQDPVFELTGTVDELPAKFPEHLRPDDGRRIILRYVPDPGSPTFMDDMDAFCALAYSHGKCCLLVHEVGVLCPEGQTRPHTRRILMHNRHRELTMINCGPRPKKIDLLVLGQADLVYNFDMPQLADRQRVAETIGFPVNDFISYMEELEPHGYLRYDANEPKPPVIDEQHPDPRLVMFPKLPDDVVADILRWKAGYRAPARAGVR